MDIIIYTKWTWTNGPEILINCPGCKKQGALTKTQETIEKNYLFHLIPLFSAQYTKLTCECGKSLKIMRPLAEVVTLDPASIESELAKDVNFLAKFCIVSSLVLFMIPIVGLVFSIIGLSATSRKISDWRRAAQIGFGLSLLPLAAAIIAIIVKVVTP